MKEIEQKQILELLQSIMEFELTGVVRYTYYSLVVSSSNKRLIVDFLKEQAKESLSHGRKVGKMLVKAGGSPSPRIGEIQEIEDFSVKNILTASMNHEKQALVFYHSLLELADSVNDEVAQFARKMIEEEGSHHEEMEEILSKYN